MVQAIYNAVGPMNALGVTASYQNEGSVWETNWQEGKEYHMLITRTFPYIDLFHVVSSFLWLQVQPVAADQTEI